MSGIDAESLRGVEAFYGALVEKVVPVGSPAEAELVKLLENTFRHVNIALVNELAMFAGDLGVDIWRAIDAASTKPFGYLRFTPGPGVGGHCLPVDPSYLSWRVRRRSGQSVPVRRARQRRQRAHARLRRAPHHRAAQQQLARGARHHASCCSASRTRPRPRTGASRRRSRSPSGSPRSAPSCSACDPHIPDGAPAGPGDGPRRLHARVARAPPTSCVLLVDHPEFDADEICRHAPLVFDAKGILRGRSFAGETL